MSKIIVYLIELYQKYLSPDSGVFKSRTPVCVFYPTCSQYAKEAYKKYGFLKGSYFSIKRILRCHPWQKKNFDPLP